MPPRPPARIARRPDRIDPALARPQLRLVRPGQDAATATARPSAPRTSGPGLMRTVAEYGGAMSEHEPGAATVTFPPPPDMAATAGPQIARSFLDEAMGAASQLSSAVQPFLHEAAPHPATQEQPSPAPMPPPTGNAPDMQEIYEAVVDRLRRDILAERERMGDVIGDILK
jgi:hypothetical protein